MLGLLKINLFSKLTQEEISMISLKAIEREYNKDEIIIHEGERSDSLFFVESGAVRVTSVFNDGREKTLVILTQGEMIGEMSLYGNITRSATVQIIERTKLFIIYRKDFLELLCKIPKLAETITETLSNRLREANDQIKELTFLNSYSRVNVALLKLAQKHGLKQSDGIIKIPIKLTHAEIARLAGVSRETASKALGELQDREAIKIENKHFTLLNLDELY